MTTFIKSLNYHGTINYNNPLYMSFCNVLFASFLLLGSACK